MSASVLVGQAVTKPRVTVAHAQLTSLLQPTRCLRGCEPFRPVAPARHAAYPRSQLIVYKEHRQQSRSGRKRFASAYVDANQMLQMDRMEKSLEATKRSFASVRTGRANPAMLDRIEVDYYGTPTPLKSIAGVSVPEATQLLVQPYDTSAMQAIEKAIMQSDLGLTPSNDGKIIRLNIPPLTADRRKEMTKTVAKLGEEGKVAVRNIRRDAMKAIERLEKDGVVGEDERKGLETSVQKLTDQYIKEIDTLTNGKAEELKKV